MKVLFLTNNLPVTLQLFEWLKQREGAANVILWSDAVSGKHFSADEALFGVEFIISYNYRYIIRQDVISMFPRKIINL